MVLLCYQFNYAQQLSPKDLKGLIEEKQSKFNLIEFGHYSEKTERNSINSTSKSEEFGDAPDWKWESVFGGTGADYVRDVVTDSAGNIYIGGSFSGTISIESDSLTSTGDKEAFVAKFDNTGDLIWITNIATETGENAEIYGICLDTINNVYATGYYTGNVSIGATLLPDTVETNLFVTKLNSSGDFIMAKNHVGSGTNEIGLNLDVDKDGNIYIIGSANGSTGWRHESNILKYDSSGNLVWEQEHDESINDIRIVDQHFYVVGNLEGHHDGIFDEDVSLTFTGQRTDAFILKSNLDGDFKWGTVAIHNMDGYNYSYGDFVGIDKDENIYMSGYLNDKVIFGTDTVDGSQGYVAKFDSTGQYIWGKSINDEAKDIAVNNIDIYVLSNNYITKLDSSGTTGWTATNQNHAEIFSVSSTGEIAVTGSSNNLIYLSQLDNSANEDWMVEFNGDAGQAGIIGMVTDSLGNVYSYGSTTNDMNFFGTTVEKGLFVCKQNLSGDIIWLKELEGVALSGSYGSYIAIDPSDENIYITGEFSDPLIISGETTLIPDGGGSIFIIKYSTNGEYKWALQEDFRGDYLCVVADYSNNVLLCGGYTESSISIGDTVLNNEGSTDIFIAKYDTNGDFLWARRAGGDIIDYTGLISVDGNDNIYFTGEFISENVSIGDSTITMLEGDGNIVFSKLNSDGKVQWVKTLAGSIIDYNDNSSWPTGIITDEQGYSYMKGWHGDSTLFDTIMLYSPYGYGYSYFIAKLDSDGNTMWANSITEHYYGFDYNQMDIDYMGNVYLGAQARDTVHFGDDFVYANVDFEDLFIAKYTSEGELDWVKTIECRDSWLSSVAVWNVNYVYLGGHFLENITIGDNEYESTNRNGFLALIGKDNVKPVISACAEDSSIHLNDSSQLLVPDLTGEIVAYDNITADSNLVITQNPEAGTYLNSGNGTTHDLIITVEDEEGNTEICTAILTGVDKTKPVISMCAEDTNINLNDNSELLVPDMTGEIVATDNCTADSNLIITQDPEPGTYLNSGDGTTHEIVITVMDEEGNSEICTVIITGNVQTDIENIEGLNGTLLIYPNPSNDQIQIHFNKNNLTEVKLSLYDLQGRLVLSKKPDTEDKITINKSEVKEPGIYVFKINNNQKYTGKIIFK